MQAIGQCVKYQFQAIESLWPVATAAAAILQLRLSILAALRGAWLAGEREAA
jgi:hypothetical protein